MGCRKLSYYDEKRGLEKSPLKIFGAPEEKTQSSFFCNSYTPFGLTFNSYQRTASTPQNYNFNGKEIQEETGWIDYGSRMYMPDIGRWGVIDPMAGKFSALSPYNFSFNNPTNIIDPDGECPTCPDDGEVGATHEYNGISYTLGENGVWTNGVGLSHDETMDFLTDAQGYLEKNGGKLGKGSLAVTVTLAKTGKSDLKASGSTTGAFKLFADVSKDFKVRGFKLFGASEKVGIQYQDGELSSFSRTEFDAMGWNYTHDVNPLTGESSSQFDIALKWSAGRIGITYRMQVEDTQLPPFEKGPAGLLGASGMRSRMTTANVYQSARSVYSNTHSEIKRTQGSMKVIQRTFQATPIPLYSPPQDATRVSPTPRLN